MNLEALKRYESLFLVHYPGGFSHPAMQTIAKRHQVDKWTEFLKSDLAKAQFDDVIQVAESLTKLIGGSSLVSVFEKTAFKNMMNGLTRDEKQVLMEAFKTLLYEDQAKGFEDVCSFLTLYKNAKWPIVTSVLYYSNPETEVIIKPSTVKKVIEVFELSGVTYTTRPEYHFYKAYCQEIMKMKQLSSEELQVDNGAYCGFLMFAVEQKAF